LGHRTGLFDGMAEMPAAGSEAIAARCGLNERYVREWLGAMVASGVVDYDPRDGTYALPPEHAAFLTRAATPADLAVYAQYIPLLGAVEDDVLACFRAGGGVPYARFERFHEVMAEDSGQTVLPVLKSHILPLVPGLDERLKDGIRVLDVGCGRGPACHAFREFPVPHCSSPTVAVHPRHARAVEPLAVSHPDLGRVQFGVTRLHRSPSVGTLGLAQRPVPGLRGISRPATGPALEPVQSRHEVGHKQRNIEHLRGHPRSLRSASEKKASQKCQLF